MTNLFSKDFKEITLKPINQVSDELKIEPYILRFWETKFSQINPTKGKGNRRLYNIEDISTIKKIKHLLYDEGFTIEGAKKHLSNNNINKPAKEDLSQQKLLINNVITELKDIKSELESLSNQ